MCELNGRSNTVELTSKLGNDVPNCSRESIESGARDADVASRFSAAPAEAIAVSRELSWDETLGGVLNVEPSRLFTYRQPGRRAGRWLGGLPVGGHGKTPFVESISIPNENARVTVNKITSVVEKNPQISQRNSSG